MSEVKAFIKKIDPQDIQLRDLFMDEFLDDIVQNEGQYVTLYNYDNEECNIISYKLKSENGVLWNQRGYGPRGFWKGMDEKSIFEKIFHITNVAPVQLPEDLFNV